MKLFSKLLSGKPSWQYSTGGAVWKLLCKEGLLFGDARDLEKHTASFFALDIQSGNVRWKNVVLPQAWWIGMQEIILDYVHEDKLKLLSLMANTFFVFTVSFASAYAILKLSFGV